MLDSSAKNMRQLGVLREAILGASVMVEFDGRPTRIGKLNRC